MEPVSLNTLKNSEGLQNQTAEKKISNKCSVCNKRVPLATQFKCGCDSDAMFCIIHRYPEAHPCTKEKEKIKLEKVVSDKLDRI